LPSVGFVPTANDNVGWYALCWKRYKSIAKLLLDNVSI
jgi:hypothetical protein